MDKQGVLEWARLPPKTCYLDDIMKIEKKKIGPQQYAPHEVWSSVLNNITVHGSNRKGIAFHHDRVLMSNELIKDAKRKQIPPPGHYNTQIKERLLYGSLSKTDKSPSFINEALNHSMEVPDHKYEHMDAWKKSQKKSFAAKIVPLVKKTDAPKKSKDPDMGSYWKESMDKLIRKKVLNSKMSEIPKVTFSEIYASSKKFVPSP